MNIQNIIGNNLLLFTVNIWIKKPGVVNIQNNFLGIINPHTSLKEALIIIEDISIFYSTVYEPWEFKTPRQKKKRFLKHPRFLNFCPSSLRFTSRKLLKYQGKKELLKHMESPWISTLINLIWIKHRFQEIFIGSPWHFVDKSKGMINIGQRFLLLDFEPKSIHHSKPIQTPTQ